jgi:hypothetical protein
MQIEEIGDFCLSTCTKMHSFISKLCDVFANRQDCMLRTLMAEVSVLKASGFCPLLYSPLVLLAHVNEGYHYHTV